MAAASAAGAGSRPGDVALAHPPKDGVTAVAFAPKDGSDGLLVSSWDSTLSLHTGSTGARLVSHAHAAPVLDCCWQTHTAALTASLDRGVRVVDFGSATSTATVLGYHGAGVRCVRWSQSHSCAVSAGWDGTVRVWDPRASKQVAELGLPSKAFGMDVCVGGVSSGAADAVVVACEGRRLVTLDLRDTSSAAEDREAALKHQLRCVAAMPGKPAGAAAWGNSGAPGVAIGSIEGRVSLEHLSPAVTGAASATPGFAFKCHRRDAGGDAGPVAHPVNAIAFNRRHGTFATGGGDGTVVLWDGGAKKRLGKPSAAFPTSVSALAFSHDSSLLAVAVSYAFEAGDIEHPPDAVVVRRLDDADIRPRAKKASA
ncbi:hypothetical protein FNF27_02757 [Cafeteria roenbergensis]|uniref:Anaphase-promoting complex subunit 4 WD40 domain-containing protein n=1 Tax=Cafeteria roenbergensis TaxID=33653 RepID=A0A5A8CDC2_CAFRO|nr:hypothetical protein FNF31_06978 [Cafeteria roenbergensis]KAA0170406.1 hypothetical protein FNF28_01401 [Cafeteria roenbergensis]KAA0175676.1 hypothetical protein FNF27_02757 [Cafeteria roenbergensis]